MDAGRGDLTVARVARSETGHNGNTRGQPPGGTYKQLAQNRRMDGVRVFLAMPDAIRVYQLVGATLDGLGVFPRWEQRRARGDLPVPRVARSDRPQQTGYW